MQTFFTPEQLTDPKLADADAILRKCVHCGFCTATCPTYVLLGDENDSPRGRIYLMKDMLEQGKPASKDVVTHIDRCLSCLACVTTCPSGVNYMHLVDHARVHIEETYRRPFVDRLLRSMLGFIMPRPSLFRWSMRMAGLAKWTTTFTSGRVRAALALVPARLPSATTLGQPGLYPATGQRHGKVALLQGCVQSVLAPEINGTTIRWLNALGFDVVVSAGEACCGSITHHMGRDHDAKARARRSIAQWLAADVDAVVITASGCGTTVKDYGFMFKDEPGMAAKAKAVSAMACDITEFLARLNLSPGKGMGRVAYHAACSLQHGQQIKSLPQQLLRQAGYEVVEPENAHLCCGSAGTYNILQPEISSKLKAMKLDTLGALAADIIVTGNIGCITQLQSGTSVPVRHIVQVLASAHRDG